MSKCFYHRFFRLTLVGKSRESPNVKTFTRLFCFVLIYVSFLIIAFSVLLPCSGKESGIATFMVGLLIENRKGRPLQGTPLRFRLRKECVVRGVSNPECDKKCANGGYCTKEKVCHCKEGKILLI